MDEQPAQENEHGNDEDEMFEDLKVDEAGKELTAKDVSDLVKKQRQMKRFGYKAIEMEKQNMKDKYNKMGKRILWVLQNEAHIPRLQSKVCEILSDHQDVLEFDAIEYPPGTPKISTFIAMDVNQEYYQK